MVLIQFHWLHFSTLKIHWKFCTIHELILIIHAQVNSCEIEEWVRNWNLMWEMSSVSMQKEHHKLHPTWTWDIHSLFCWGWAQLYIWKFFCNIKINFIVVLIEQNCWFKKIKWNRKIVKTTIECFQVHCLNK